MTRVWDDVLSALDHEVLDAAGYTTRGAVSWNSRGLGASPALLIIDMEKQGVGPDVPILEAVKAFPTAVGEQGWRAAEHIQGLLDTARSLKIPVAHTRAFLLPGQPEDANEIIEPLRPLGDEFVFQRECASAFYGTHLNRFLVRHQVDTVIIVGTSTSGCIRASAVDAQQNGFRVVLPEECVFDRVEVSHKVALFDIWLKYGNVLDVAEVLEYLRRTVSTEAPVLVVGDAS